ncbi:MAG: HAD family hydrolase [Gemmatimonadota bacterium]
MNGRLVFATDLDGTLAAGDPMRRAQLLELLCACPDLILLYVTGRSVDSARGLVMREKLPAPAMLIADVGATVVHGLGPRHVTEVERRIQPDWPGPEPVRARLANIEELEAQHIVAARRVSYWIRPVRQLRQTRSDDDFAARDPRDPSLSAAAGRTAAFVARRAAAALHDLPIDVLLSANVYLDILPKGVNKGSTLLRVLRFIGCEAGSCIVAGDSLNDHALFEIGARGILVGNSEPALRAALAGQAHVYFAQGVGAGGVLEGLRHFGVLPSPASAQERQPSLAE